MHDVFLSYASADRDRARHYAEWFESQGWSVWWDRTILPGKRWDETIERELGAARTVVVLWSNQSIVSDWVKIEAAEALRRKVLVPVLIDDVQPPLEFRRLQAVDLAGWRGAGNHPELQLLAQAVASNVAHPAARASPSKPAHRSRKRFILAAAAASAGLVVALASLYFLGVSPRRPGSEIAATAERLRVELVKKADDSNLYWPYFLEREGGAASLQVVVLTALEAVRRGATDETVTTLRRSLALLPRALRVFPHTDAVQAVALSPDGKLVATASDDHTAAVWEVQSGRRLARSEHEGGVRYVTFAPDGRAIATASRDKAARVVEIDGGRELVRLRHADSVDWVAFAPDGQSIVTVAGRNAYVWSFPGGEARHRFEHEWNVRTSALSRDGVFLVLTFISSADAVVWDIRTGQLASRLPVGWSPGGIAFSEPILALGSEKDGAALWRTGDWSRVRNINAKITGPAVAFSPDGRTLALSSPRAVYGIVALSATDQAGEVRNLWWRKNGGVYHIAFDRQGERLLAVSQDQTAQVLDVRTGWELLRVRTGAHAHLSRGPAVFASNDRQLITFKDNVAELWDLVPENPEAEACMRVGRNLTQNEWTEFIGPERYRKTCPDRP
jgi:WD40 repeat protein